MFWLMIKEVGIDAFKREVGWWEVILFEVSENI
jgi:hypothetical protein